jgi:glycosyltransferase involved in cell wall biosynthesis
LVTLQGDDIFLEDLTEPYKSQALQLIRDLVPHIDGFLAFSNFYAKKMGSWLEIPPEKIHIVPMGIDLRGIDHPTPTVRTGPRKIGYFARLAPEKGLHLLVDAFLELRSTGRFDDTELQIAGWLGDHHRDYVDQQFDKLQQAGLTDACHYAGELDRIEKHEFLEGLDLFSVPTTYQDPKGIFVLEALAAGVPVIQPDHGAFPELLATTGGGRLVRPDDPGHLAEILGELLDAPESRLALGAAGQQTVRDQCHAEAMAEATLSVYQNILQGRRPPK